MNELVATCAAEIRHVARERIRELGITYETVDEIAGFPARYTNKLLCEPPMKNFSVDSMFALLGAVALTPAMQPDSKRLERLQKRLEWAVVKRAGKQYRPRMHTVAVHEPIIVQLSPNFFAEIGRRGGTNSRKNVGKRKRKQLARKAALVRWSDVRQAVQR